MTSSTTMAAPQKTARSPTSDTRFPFMHARDTLKAGELAVVQCSNQCYIMLMDDENLTQFEEGRKFHYYGGFYKMFPATIAAPTSGDWNVVIHIGGKTAPFAYSVNFKKR